MQPLTEEDRIKKAELASTLAFLAVLLCLMVNCGGCFMLFAALPISLLALQQVRIAMDGGGDVHPLISAYAVPARNISIATTIFSSILLLLIIAYVTLYVGIIFFAVVLAAINP